MKKEQPRSAQHISRSVFGRKEDDIVTVYVELISTFQFIRNQGGISLRQVSL